MHTELDTKYTNVDIKAVREHLAQTMAICTLPERYIQWYLYDVIDQGTKRQSGHVELRIDEGRVIMEFTAANDAAAPKADEPKAEETKPEEVTPASEPPTDAPAQPAAEPALRSSLIPHGELTVSSFQDAHAFLESIGLRTRTFQEKKRETWEVEGTKVHIDSWPWLEPMVVIEDDTKGLAAKLGLTDAQRTEDSIDKLYMAKYKIDSSMFLNMEELKFMMRPDWAY